MLRHADSHSGSAILNHGHSVGRSVITKRRAHLCRLAEALVRQTRHKSRHVWFQRWKLYIIMRAIQSICTSNLLASKLPVSSTSTGTGTVPITLLLRLGKKQTIKKKVMSSNKIYATPVLTPPTSPVVAPSPVLESMGAFLFPSGGSSLTTAGDLSSPFSSSAAAGIPPALMPSYTSSNNANVSTAELLKEIAAMRVTIEAQKRTIDMRDRYINDLTRQRDDDASQRDLQRDEILAQLRARIQLMEVQLQECGAALPSPSAVAKETKSLLASKNGLLFPKPQQAAAPATLSPTLHVTLGTQTDVMGMLVSGFPSPPSVSPSPTYPGRVPRQESSEPGGPHQVPRKKRNSIDNSGFLISPLEQPLLTTSNQHSAVTSSSVVLTSSNQIASSATNGSVAALATAGNPSGRRTIATQQPNASNSNSVRCAADRPVPIIRGDCKDGSSLVTLSISSLIRPPPPSTDPSGGGGTPRTTGAGNVSASSSLSSLPNSSRKAVTALRGTAILPQLASTTNSNTGLAPPKMIAQK